MTITPIKYNFDINAYNAIVGFGYPFVNLNGKDFLSLIKDKFPNLNLFRILNVVENKFIPTSSSPITRNIEFDYLNGHLKFSVSNNLTDEDDALKVVRTLKNLGKSIEITHDYCVIPKTHRGNKLVQDFFQESLQQYINIGVSKIKVEAGLSGGGYVWARHGFTACNKHEVRAILQSAKKGLNKRQFIVTKTIFDGYYNNDPTGKDFPIDLWSELPFMKNILMGSYWNGELNLKNKEQLDNFISYVYR